MVQVELKKENGQVTWAHDLSFLLNKIPNGEYVCEIKEVKRQRTTNQNALMWMWFKCIEDETGTDKQDLHDFYCSMFLARQVEYHGKVKWVVGQTSKLNTIQMKEFLDKVQAHAAAELGIVLPLPSDRYYKDFVDYYKNRT